MRDIHSADALQAALQYMMSSDIPSDHKAVVLELLTRALRDRDTQRIEAVASAHESIAWQDDETSQMRTFLGGKVANSWQHADELLMQLAHHLHRDPNYVRSKATELGFGESVDFRLAKLRARAAAEK